MDAFKELIDEFKPDIVNRLIPCLVCQQIPFAGIAYLPDGFRAYIIGCEHCGWGITSSWDFGDLISQWNTKGNGRE